MAWNAEFKRAAARTFEKIGLNPNTPTPRYPRGDVASRRKGVAFLEAVLALEPESHSDIEKTEYKISGYGQAQISLFACYRKTVPAASSQSAVLYIHGGGMIFGSPTLFEPIVQADVAATGVAHFSVGYRVAPEVQHPTPVEDCYAALLWLSTHARELGIDPSRIAICGLSAGGGLAAGTALLARDRGLQPPIAKQILLTPMLDDRNTVTDSSMLPSVTWSWDDNWTGWNALLGNALGSSSISQYAAPARAPNLQGLPPTFIDVGSLDIFLEEDSTYAESLKAAGVEVELHVYDGVPHGFEFRAQGTSILTQALCNRRAAVSSI